MDGAEKGKHRHHRRQEQHRRPEGQTGLRQTAAVLVAWEYAGASQRWREIILGEVV